jgi:hypothetical protein
VDNNCPHCDAIILLPSFVAHYPQLLPCLPGLFFSIQSARIKRIGDICQTPLSSMPETPVAAETRDQRDIGTISVPVLPVPDQTLHQTDRVGGHSVTTILASHWGYQPGDYGRWCGWYYHHAVRSGAARCDARAVATGDRLAVRKLTSGRSATAPSHDQAHGQSPCWYSRPWE